VTAGSVALSRLSPGLPRWSLPLAFGVAIAAIYVALRGTGTITHDDDAPFFQTLNEFREFIEDNRNNIPLIAPIRAGVDFLVETMIGGLTWLTWPGVVAVFVGLGFGIGGWKLALLGATGALSFGVLGLWESSIGTLGLTLASVLIALALGIPIGIAAGRNARLMRLISPILDFLQIMPTFAYLAPLALLFLIGSPTAAIATVLYAIPPAIRITALGIRSVSTTTVEAATAMGSTRWQTLRKVQLPMARSTIILGINQTMMMALSMVVITVLVDAPGLGKDILRALQTVDVGAAFDAGLAIVIMAILLDRFTSTAGERADPKRQALTADRPDRSRQRWAIAAAIGAGGILLGRLAMGGAPDFPEEIAFSFQGAVNDVTNWLRTNANEVTEAIKNIVTFGLINPIEGVLTSAPWWLVVVALVGVALFVSGVGPAIGTVICLGLILALQVWEHSMQTLTTVVVGTAITLAIGTFLGIVSARSPRFSAILRPLLDAAQTMPAFVYLLPAVALFGPTRFTAIVAALIYAVPPVIRLVEAGIRLVPATVVEAGTAAGSTPRQLLWKVQLPMARPALLVAANQGIILVLAMVVVGGLVGAGGLGYDVVAGFARRDFFGEGLAAAMGIVLLGIMLDRITQGAGRRKPSPVRTLAIPAARSAA
jgi:glycine betaine/proline transport system permease protein